MTEFILNNQHIKTTENSGVTLLDFIRTNQGLKGTKIGCREGDCGACTILVGTLDKNNAVVYESITSCISPLGNAHGKHVLTIEGLNLNKKLNTAQQLMANNHGTQCGFCTPGFIVSLTGLSMKKSPLSLEDGKDAISGNICRCTGYKSIERATSELITLLKNKSDDGNFDWLIKNNFVPDYINSIASKLRGIKAKKNIPSNINFVAGGTDLYVKNADNLAKEDVHLLLKNELNAISFYKNNCVIGGETTSSDLMNNNSLRAYLPDLYSYLKLVSSEPIRNMATITGNFVNASPIGDMTQLFLALDSNIVIKNDKDKLRTVELKKFYQSYKVYDLQKGETIVNISFDVPDQFCFFNFEKVSKRTHLDIASVNSGCCVKVIKNKIVGAHIAFGGVAPIPLYLQKTTAFLKDKELTIDTIQQAQTIVQQEIAPISDVRGSVSYKRLLVRQLFFAHFTKLFPKHFKLTELVNS